MEQTLTIRYSGDAEIRLSYDAREHAYRGTVVDPYLRLFPTMIPVARRHARDPRSSEAYDDAAKRLAEVAQKWAKRHGRAFMFGQKKGRLHVYRVFQSPCPLD